MLFSSFLFIPLKEVHDLCHCLRTSYDKLKQVLLVRTIQLAGNSNSKSKMMEAATSSTSINSNIIINTAATTARSSESISSATGLSPTAGLNSTPTIYTYYMI